MDPSGPYHLVAVVLGLGGGHPVAPRLDHREHASLSLVTVESTAITGRALAGFTRGHAARFHGDRATVYSSSVVYHSTTLWHVGGRRRCLTIRGTFRYPIDLDFGGRRGLKRGFAAPRDAEEPLGGGNVWQFGFSLMTWNL